MASNKIIAIKIDPNYQYAYYDKSSLKEDLKYHRGAKSNSYSNFQSQYTS